LGLGKKKKTKRKKMALGKELKESSRKKKKSLKNSQETRCEWGGKRTKPFINNKGNKGVLRLKTTQKRGGEKKKKKNLAGGGHTVKKRKNECRDQLLGVGGKGKAVRNPSRGWGKGEFPRPSTKKRKKKGRWSLGRKKVLNQVVDFVRKKSVSEKRQCSLIQKGPSSSGFRTRKI